MKIAKVLRYLFASWVILVSLSFSIAMGFSIISEPGLPIYDIGYLFLDIGMGLFVIGGFSAMILWALAMIMTTKTREK